VTILQYRGAEHEHLQRYYVEVSRALHGRFWALLTLSLTELLQYFPREPIIGARFHPY